MKFSVKSVFYVILLLVNMGSSLLIPIITEKIIDSASIEYNSQQVNYYGILFFVIICFYVLSLALSYYIKNDIEENYMLEQRKIMIKQINEIDYKILKKQSTGYYLQRFSDDIECIRQFILEKKVKFVTNIIFGICIISIMLYLNYIYTILLLSIFPLIVGIQIFFNKKIKKSTKEIAKYKEIVNTQFEETVNQSYMLRANNAQPFSEHRLNTSLTSTTAQSLKKSVLETFYDYILITGLLNLASWVIYYLGARFILDEKITLGMLTSFSLYYSKLWNPVEFFLAYPKDFTEYKIHKNRVDEIAKLSGTEKNYLYNSIDSLMCLSIRSLSYKVDDHLIFNNLNFQIVKGEKIGIIGSNGSGKTTLANIISGIINDYVGDVKYNGINYVDINPKELRYKIALIPASIDLLNTTVIENITLSTKSVKEDKSLDFIRSFIESHSFNFETIIESNGANLSSGEGKIIQLSRGLYQNAECYIFDEPLNFIDKDYVSNVIQFIRENFNDKTLIIISHDNRALSLCNKIYEIQDKKLIQKK